MFSGIWKWFYLGVCFNKMVKFKFNFLLFFLIINSGSYISKAQKLFIPISDQEIISIYKTGEKKNDGSYESKDKNGNVRIKLEAGIQSGKILRLRGKGLSSINSYGNGDLLVHVNVWTPKTLNKEQRIFFEQMKENDNFIPSPEKGEKSFFEKVKDMFS